MLHLAKFFQPSRTFATGKIPLPQTQPSIIYNGIFINNEWCKSRSGKTFDTVNPSTGDIITKVQQGEIEDVNDAVAAAKKAFKLGSEWRQMDASHRGYLLYKLADLIERDQIYLASLETFDSGKSYRNTYSYDIPESTKILRYYAGWADKNHGKVIPMDGKCLSYTRHEPVGVCGQIIPWNFPLIMAAWKIAPAVATGNTLVLKPAKETPLTALYLAALSKEAGFPDGVVNVVPGLGDVGIALATHEDVDKVVFTGSTVIGKLVQQGAATSNLKRTTLELGGKSPNIIFKDVDIDDAVESAHLAAFFNMGQTCCSGSRTFVEDDIYDEFVEKSAIRAQKVTVGDPFDFTVEHGALISERQLNRILSMIESGKQEGAKLVAGGQRIGNKGFFMAPTVFADVRDEMEMARKETFGPIQQILKFSDLKEVIERANDTEYGLAAAVFTKDFDKANYIVQGLRAGIVWVNTYYAHGSQAPFGGYKQSGQGRECGEYGIEAYTEVKSVIIKLLEKNS